MGYDVKKAVAFAVVATAAIIGSMLILEHMVVVCKSEVFSTYRTTIEELKAVKFDGEVGTYFGKNSGGEILIYDYREPQSGYITTRSQAHIIGGTLYVKLMRSVAADEMWATGTDVLAKIRLPIDAKIGKIKVTSKLYSETIYIEKPAAELR